MVVGPVSSGTLGGPEMFFIALIDQKMMVTNKTILKIMIIKTMGNFLEMTMTTGKTLAMKTRTRANVLWMTMIRTVIMTTGKTILLTMAMKMRMRTNSMLFGIPSLLNRMVMKTGMRANSL